MTGQSVVLSGARLDGVELILSGLLGEVDGYVLPGEARTGWPASPALSLPHRVDIGASVSLEDPDGTPLASLQIEDVRADEGGVWWAAGSLTAQRSPEHGVGRELRLTRVDDLSDSVVALFAGRIRVADVLRAIDSAGERPLVFAYSGASDAPETARALRELTDAAQLRDRARVRFFAEPDFGEGGDVALAVLGGLGARDVIDLRRTVEHSSGAVVLFTGLSGAGKSTLARALVEHLHAHSAQPTVLLDGDDVRRELAGELGFSREDRDRNVQRIAWVAARLAEVGAIAVCAPIAPFVASRAAMRAKVEPASRFFIVYVSTPLAVAEARDRKGLYAKARAGLIPDFTGIDSPYEEPTDADLVLDTSVMSVQECTAAVVRMLADRGPRF